MLVSQKLNSFLLNHRRKIKCAVCFQRFGIKLLSRAAFQAGAVGCFALHERTADVLVPASEELGYYADLSPKNACVNSISSLFT